MYLYTSVSIKNAMCCVMLQFVQECLRCILHVLLFNVYHYFFCLTSEEDESPVIFKIQNL